MISAPVRAVLLQTAQLAFESLQWFVALTVGAGGLDQALEVTAVLLIACIGLLLHPRGGCLRIGIDVVGEAALEILEGSTGIS